VQRYFNGRVGMYGIFYIIGVVVVIVAVLGYFNFV
jgi:predicted acyl esterase